MSGLGFDEILTIYKYISLNFTASQIAMKMHIAPSTLYRILSTYVEIKQRTTFSLSYHYHECKNVPACKKTIKRCPAECARFEKYLCDKLHRFPFICDFCESRSNCGKERHIWNPVLVIKIVVKNTFSSSVG